MTDHIQRDDDDDDDDDDNINDDENDNEMLDFICYGDKSVT